MRRALIRGIRLALKAWPLVLFLWLVHGLFGLSASVAGGFWLSQALDSSLATRTLLRDLDPHVLIDLYFHHRASAQMLWLFGVFLAAAYVLLWTWFHVAVIVSVRADDRAASLLDALRRGAPHMPRMLALWFIALLPVLGTGALFGGAAWLALRWTAASSHESTPYVIVASAVFGALTVLIFLTAVHDHARIRACATGNGPFSAYRWALRFVLRGGERAYLLALALHLVGFILWLIYEFVGLGMSADGAFGVAGLVVWGELHLLARMLLRFWFFGAQADLQSAA